MSERLNVVFINGQFPNYYELLSVSPDASERDIIAAYRKLALDQHPDKAGCSQAQNDTFAHINNAKDVLTDRQKRGQYDAQLLQHRAAARKPMPQRTGNKSTQAPSQPRPSPRPAPRHQRPETHYSHPLYNPMRPNAPFNRFFEPASAYPPNAKSGRSGTKPPGESAWAQTLWKGISVGQMHDTACKYAIMICSVAKRIEEMVWAIEGVAGLHLNLPSGLTDYKNLHQRFGCGHELLVELMHFVGISYHHHRTQMDKTTLLSASSAAPLLEEHRNVCEKLMIIMASTRDALKYFVPELRDRTLSIGVLLDKLVSIFEEWNDFCELPSNILAGIDDTFFVIPHQRTNRWERKRGSGLFGYQNKPFVLIDPIYPAPQASKPDTSKESSSNRPEPRREQQSNQSSEEQHRQHNSGNSGSKTSGFSGFAWASTDWRSKMAP